MTLKFLSADEFRAAAKDGARPEAAVFRLATGTPDIVSDRVTRFVFSDDSIDRAGDRIMQDGWQTDEFAANPVALFSHMSWEPPIGRATNVGVKGGKLVGDIEFASVDVYPFADTICRLVKGGYLNAVSVGFLPTEWRFTDDKTRPYGMDFTKQTLLEISVCCVPCNSNALVQARAVGIDTAPLREWAERVLDGDGGSVLVPRRLLEQTFRAAKTPIGIRRTYLGKDDGADWKCGAARDLPVDDSDTWDGPAAEASIFEHAGGDDFDPAKARPGFLLYDASAPKLRGSYKEPFAHVVDGELKAVKAGIRAAASRLPQTDVPQGAKDEARAVIDHYEAAMKDAKAMGEDDAPAIVPPGNCGRGKDMDCGMTDPEECSVHFMPPNKSLPEQKAGRRISAKNRASIESAMGHHAQATKCLQDVLNSDAPEDDPSDPETEGLPNLADDPEKQRAARLAEAKRLRESLN